MMDYKLRASRGTMTVIRATSSADELYEKTCKLIEEGYDAIEVRTPDGLLLHQNDLSKLIEEKKMKKPGCR